LPMWVFDGNGFTMACLAVWIRTVALRWDRPQWRGAQERWMRRHPTAPVNVARISVTTSVTDFTAPEADFAALLPRRPNSLNCHLGNMLEAIEWADQPRWWTF
jgi:hypothetical protein